MSRGVVRLVEVSADTAPESETQEEQEAPMEGLNPEHLRMLEAILFAASEPLAVKVTWTFQ